MVTSPQTLVKSIFPVVLAESLTLLRKLAAFTARAYLMSKSNVLVIVGACVLFAVLAWVGVRVVGQFFGVQTYEGYFAPVYSPDGQYVYFIQRRVSGTTRVTENPGFIFGGAPTYDVSIAKDTFSLKRLKVQSGQIEELTALAPSPIEGRRYESKGNMFQSARASLKFTKEGQLEFRVCLKTELPTEKEYLSSGIWTEAQQSAKISRSWEESQCATGTNEWPLFGDWELLEAHGEPDYFTVAIVAYNHVTGEIKPLVKSKGYTRAYPNGVPLRQIQESSRRQELERFQAITRTREELLQKYKSMGMGDVQAELRIIKDLQRLGYYPKPTTIVARRLSRDEVTKINKDALFSIAKEEMASGIFQDIEKAVASPGEEIDHDSSGYYIHRDYTTSARLNAFLEAGKTQFYVRYLGETYEMTIKKPEPLK